MHIAKFSSLSLALALLVPVVGHTQVAPAPRAEVAADAAPTNLEPLFAPLTEGENQISVPGAQWLQLRFISTSLGANGRIVISKKEGTQELNQEAISNFDGLSVIFNGDNLTVTLEGDGALATVGQIVVGLPAQVLTQSELVNNAFSAPGSLK